MLEIVGAAELEYVDAGAVFFQVEEGHEQRNPSQGLPIGRKLNDYIFFSCPPLCKFSILEPDYRAHILHIIGFMRYHQDREPGLSI